MILAPPQQVNNYKSSASQEIIILTRGENIPTGHVSTCAVRSEGNAITDSSLLILIFNFMFDYVSQ